VLPTGNVATGLPRLLAAFEAGGRTVGIRVELAGNVPTAPLLNNPYSCRQCAHSAPAVTMGSGSGQPAADEIPEPQNTSCRSRGQSPTARTRCDPEPNDETPGKDVYLVGPWALTRFDVSL
jgi:hypothetical protein